MVVCLVVFYGKSSINNHSAHDNQTNKAPRPSQELTKQTLGGGQTRKVERVQRRLKDEYYEYNTHSVGFPKPTTLFCDLFSSSYSESKRTCFHYYSGGIVNQAHNGRLHQSATKTTTIPFRPLMEKLSITSNITTIQTLQLESEALEQVTQFLSC